jgi:hypothetical protein
VNEPWRGFAVLLVLAVEVAPGWAAPPPRKIRAVLAAPPTTSQLWLEVTPLPLARTSIVRVLPKGQVRAVLEVPAGPALVCAGGDESVATQCATVDASIDADVSFRLDEGTPVLGRIRVGDHPATGADIAVTPIGITSKKPFKLALWLKDGVFGREIPVSADGGFKVPRLAAGDYRVEIRESGGRLSRSADFTVPPRTPRLKPGLEPYPSIDLGEISLPEGLLLTVRVEDPIGRPIADAAVGAIQMRSKTPVAFFASRTDPSGVAQLTGLDASLETKVTCTRGSISREELFDTLPADVLCSLAIPGGLEGEIVAADSRPLPGAVVALKTANLSTTTDDKGHFRFSELIPGSHELIAVAARHSVRRLTIEIGSGERRTLDRIVLDRVEPRRGLVVDKTSRTPIAGASVASVWPPGAVQTLTTTEGSFDIEIADSEPLDLMVTAPDHAPATARFLNLPDPAEPQVIELARPGWIAVEVRDADSAPCLACILHIQGASTLLDLTTDGRGEAVSTPVTPGRYVVTLENVKTEGSIVMVSGGDNSRFAEVNEGQTTKVVFRQDARELIVSFEPAPPPNWLLVASGTRATETEHPEPDGTFVVRRRVDELLVLELTDGSGTVVAQAQLAEQDRRRSVSLPLSPSRVEGRITRGSSAEPLTNKRVALLSVVDRRVVGQSLTDNAGGFSIPYLRPGNYIAAIESWVMGQPIVVPEHGVVDMGTISVPEQRR